MIITLIFALIWLFVGISWLLLDLSMRSPGSLHFGYFKFAIIIVILLIFKVLLQIVVLAFPGRHLRTEKRQSRFLSLVDFADTQVDIDDSVCLVLFFGTCLSFFGIRINLHSLAFLDVLQCFGVLLYYECQFLQPFLDIHGILLLLLGCSLFATPHQFTMLVALLWLWARVISAVYPRSGPLSG